MNKEDLIQYWKATSAKDWKRVGVQLKTRDYVFALFCAHLCLEKLIKAHWVKDNISNYPPKIHNLNKLVAQTKLALTDRELVFCADINKFQIEGRYPDFVSGLKKKLSGKEATNYLKECQNLRKRLANELP